MGKETQSERNSNPIYFEVIQCSASGCDRKTDLLKHNSSEEILCVDCVNKLVEEIEHAKMIEEEESMNFRDENEALTLWERNR